MAKSKRPATYDDLAKLPENMVGEILGGELIATPRPAPPHAMASASIMGALFGQFHDREPGPYTACVEMRIQDEATRLFACTTLDLAPTRNAREVVLTPSPGG